MIALIIAALAVWLWWCLVFAEHKPFIFALTAPVFIIGCIILWPLAKLIEVFNLLVDWVYDYPSDL